MAAPTPPPDGSPAPPHLAFAPRKGRVEKIMGPMFSGKTGSAMAAAHSRLAVGDRVVYVTREDDTRFGEGAGEVQTHTGHRFLSGTLSRGGEPDSPGGSPPPRSGIEISHRRLQVLRVPTALAGNVAAAAAAYGAALVVIDEAQFFAGLAAEVRALSRGGIDTLLCGLDFTAEMLPFGELTRVPADDIRHMRALCVECKKPAAFSLRRAPAQREGVIEDVGGADKYVAVCRDHHPLL